MDLVIGVGFIFTDDITQLAKEYPEHQLRRRRLLARRPTRTGNVIPPPPNVAALKFKEEEGSFLVGAIAALVGKSKKVGFVGGMDVAAHPEVRGRLQGRRESGLPRLRR